MSNYQEMKLADRYGGRSPDLGAAGDQVHITIASADEWGGEAGRLERRALFSRRVSTHRREVSRAKRTARRHWLAALAVPASAGMYVEVTQLTTWSPSPALILLGVLLIIPFLTLLTEDPV